MSTVYSLIPGRSLSAYSNVGSLVEVLCALITDPDEADDAAREYGVAGTPHSLSDFALTSGANGASAALQTVAEWTMQQKWPEIAIRQIITWDRRVGVWCACRVAREALRFVPEDEARPRLAIETAERWVVGNAPIEEVRAARERAYAAANAAANAAYDAAADAAAYTANAAAADAAYAAYAAADAYAEAYCASAADAARAAADAATYAAGRSRGQAWDRAKDAELVRLREVIANACLTFPR